MSVDRKQRGKRKYRAIELYHKDSPFKPKVIEDKRKKKPKHKKKEDEVQEMFC